jgi:hypothetical protein
MKTLSSLLFALGFALSSHAQGYVEAISSYDSSNVGSQDGTIGYSFRANASMTVSDIGVFANILQATSPMRVGLWDSAGNLLADKNITSSSPQTGTSRYEPLTTPVSLVGDQVYHIGAWFPTTFSYSIVGKDFGGSITTSPGIALIGYVANPTGFAFPTPVTGGEGIFALTGNLLIPSVPEPATAALILVSLLTYAGLRSRHNHYK